MTHCAVSWPINPYTRGVAVIVKLPQAVKETPVSTCIRVAYSGKKNTYSVCCLVIALYKPPNTVESMV